MRNPHKIEMLKMELGGNHGCHKKRCHDRQIASEIQIQRKVNKTTGNYRPCFFSANFWRTNSIKASFAPTSLQSCTRCAYGKTRGRHVKFSNASHWSWPKSSSGGILKQFWLKSISRINRWLSKSPTGSKFKVLLLKSSFSRLLRFRKRPSGSVLNLLPCKWSSLKLLRFRKRSSGSVLNLLPCKSSFSRLLRFRKTWGGRTPNWFFAMLRIRRLSTLSKMRSSRVVKLLLDRSRWCTCFNPFKAPGKNEVNLLPCRKSLPCRKIWGFQWAKILQISLPTSLKIPFGRQLKRLLLRSIA